MWRAASSPVLSLLLGFVQSPSLTKWEGPCPVQLMHLPPFPRAPFHTPLFSSLESPYDLGAPPAMGSFIYCLLHVPISVVGIKRYSYEKTQLWILPPPRFQPCLSFCLRVPVTLFFSTFPTWGASCFRFTWWLKEASFHPLASRSDLMRQLGF